MITSPCGGANSRRNLLMSMTIPISDQSPGNQLLVKVLGLSAIALQLVVLSGLSDSIPLGPLAPIGLSVVLLSGMIVGQAQAGSRAAGAKAVSEPDHLSSSGVQQRIDTALAGTIEIMEASLDNNVRQQSLLDRTKLVIEKSTPSLRDLLQENAAIRVEVRTLENRLRDMHSEAVQLRSELENARTENVTDGLTGLKNRKWFDARLAAEIKNSNNSGKPLTLAIADLDKFKAINDTYGHVTGDRILQWAGERLTQNVKGRDCAARYGGEEFAIILPQTDLRDAATLLEQIRSQFEAVEWTHALTGRNMGHVTASFGAAQLKTGERPKDLIERADKNLYAAKSAGRNKVVAR